MKGLSGIALSTGLLIAMISASGCVCGPINNVFPYQVPFIATPTPLPVPTLQPTATPIPPPQPTVIVQQSSYDVRIHPAFINFEATKSDAGQTENVTVVVMNDGGIVAQNVKLTLTIDDATRGNNLIMQSYTVGDLQPGDRKIFSMNTNLHAPADSVYVSLRVVWGKYGEYSNPDTFINHQWTVF